MSMKDVYFVAQQPAALLQQLCDEHDILLSRKVLCRALATCITEEWHCDQTIPEDLADRPIPALSALLQQSCVVVEGYDLKLKLWLLLYLNKAHLHLPDTAFARPSTDVVDTDTVDDVLVLPCFQDSFDEWMGQDVARLDEPTKASALAQPTPKVDVIALSLPPLPRFEEEAGAAAFQENPELASLVLDIVKAETGSTKRRSLWESFLKKES